MIEVTDEMVELFKLNHDPANELEQPDIRAGLAAVLAIVERDYEPKRCDDQGWTGVRCTEPRGHEHGHKDRWSGAVWP